MLMCYTDMHNEGSAEPGQSPARLGSEAEELLLYVDWPLAAACRKQLAENNGQGWVYFIRLHKYAGIFSLANRYLFNPYGKRRYNHD